MIRRRTALKAAASTLALPMLQAQPSAPTGLLNVLDYGAVGDGVTNDLPAFLACLAAAQSTRAIGMYVPIGIYRLSNTTAGRILELVKPGLKIVGDGPAFTTLLLDDNLTLTGNTPLICLTGARQSVTDLSIVGGANASGAFNQYGISATQGAVDWHLARLDVSGIYGAGTAGGSCFDFYQPSAINGGVHNGLAEGCVAHDAPNATGFIINSQGSAFYNCRSVRCGNMPTRHNFYIQGGDNAFERCVAESAGGYNWHNYAAVPDRAASYNTYRDCVSIDPIFGHFTASSINASASNPDVPVGTPLNRGVTLSGFLFRRTKTGPPCFAGVGGNVPLLIDGCTFEDTLGAAGAWVSVGAGSRVTGSLFRQISTVQNIVGIVTSGGAIASENQFINWLAGTAIRADGLSGVWNNSGDLYGSSLGLYVNGPDVQHDRNIFQVHGNAKAFYGNTITG